MDDMGFKYQIGDVMITHISIAEASQLCEVGRHRTPLIGIVVERMWQECPGGIQRHYKLAFKDGSTIHNEIELAALDAFDWSMVNSHPPKDWSDVARLTKTALDTLQVAKELFVAEINFDAAAAVRDLIDKLKAKGQS